MKKSSCRGLRGKAVCEKLDALAAKLGVSRTEGTGRLLEAALNKPRLAAEFVRLEEKKRRLIRYIM